MTVAKCHSCGRELIAPYDGHPYWCVECSYEDELKERAKENKVRNNETR
jgi:DNA-directed RNA polymerase subunit RPC12/RpoP